MSKIKYYIFLSLLWLFMLFFSHDFMAAKLNMISSETTELLTTGEYDLVIDSMSQDDVISSFWQNWTQVDSGLKPLNQNPEVSIDLGEFRIIPLLHDGMTIKINSKEHSKGRFRIELSNQNKTLFYDSREFALEDLNKPIDLSTFEWMENPINRSGQIREVNWSSLNALDGLVIRFFEIEPDDFVLNAVSLNHAPDLAQIKTVDNGNECVLTNCMRFEHNTMLHSIGFNSLQIETVSQYQASVWLLAAWLTAVFLLSQKRVKSIRPFVLVSFAFIFVLLAHQSWIAGIVLYVQWPLLVMLAALTYKYRTYLIEVKHRAGFVWLVTVSLAVTLLLFNRQIEFLYTLPVYFLWAMVQQLVLGPLFSTYLIKQMNCTKLECATLVGVLFSIIHAPNHMLMFATLIGGVAWSYSWLKYQNIYANAFSHALLALLFYQVMPEMLLNSARVGVFF